MFGARSSIVFKLIFLACVVLGSIITAKSVLGFGDLAIMLMSFPNIIGLYLLQGHVARELKSYEADIKSGKIAPHH